MVPRQPRRVGSQAIASFVPTFQVSDYGVAERSRANGLGVARVGAGLGEGQLDAGCDRIHGGTDGKVHQPVGVGASFAFCGL